MVQARTFSIWNMDVSNSLNHSFSNTQPSLGSNRGSPRVIILSCQQAQCGHWFTVKKAKKASRPQVILKTQPPFDWITGRATDQAFFSYSRRKATKFEETSFLVYYITSTLFDLVRKSHQYAMKKFYFIQSVCKKTSLKIFKHYKLKPSFSIIKDEKEKDRGGGQAPTHKFQQFDQV